MDGLSQRCWRLRSTQLRFRDCSMIIQTRELELQAPMGCPQGLLSAGRCLGGGSPQLRRGGERLTALEHSACGRRDSRYSLSSLGPGAAFLPAVGGQRHRLPAAASTGCAVRAGTAGTRAVSRPRAAPGAGGWEFISGSFPCNQEAGDASPASGNGVSDGRRSRGAS